MTVIIYTYPADYHMAGVSARMLSERQGLNVVLAIDESSPPFACEFGTVVRTRFDRKGNLNGPEFMQGHLRLMAECATGDYTLKLDSDTVLLDAQRLLKERTETVVGLWVAGTSGMNGCCYALRTAFLPAMIREADQLDSSEHHMEDQTTGRIAMKVGTSHFERWGDAACLYGTHSKGGDPAWHREHHAVVCLEVRPDSDRPDLAAKMKALYQA